MERELYSIGKTPTVYLLTLGRLARAGFGLRDHPESRSSRSNLQRKLFEWDQLGVSTSRFRQRVVSLACAIGMDGGVTSRDSKGEKRSSIASKKR